MFAYDVLQCCWQVMHQRWIVELLSADVVAVMLPDLVLRLVDI